jgi:predicted metalloprotease
VVIFLIASLLGIDPTAILPSEAPAEEPAAGPAENDPMRDFVSAILGDTDETWEAIFAAQGATYRQPTIVLFSGMVQSACGFAQAAVGPFYCPLDQKVYLDLTFFQELADRFEAPGDFARAYVIAHEVGHHVQTLLGISEQVQRLRSRASQEEANALSVQQELQADCFSGVWAYHARHSRQLLEAGDVEEGLAAASAVGDDRLQQQAQGYVVPESFTHGSSAERASWFRRGLQSGDPEACDTFSR